MWTRLRSWLFGVPKFKPGIFYNEERRQTDILLRDVAITWQSWGDNVEFGYDSLGNLAGVRVWDDIRKRKWGW